MGTPHVHCMSRLPTAHEPADREGRGARESDEKYSRRESKETHPIRLLDR